MTSNDSNLWHHSASLAVTTPQLDGNKTADLVIIGAGFSGCSAALEAIERGLTVILVESDTIGHGGSGRNVGLANAGLWTPPDEVEKTLGADAGKQLNAVLAKAPDLVFDLIDTHKIACEATRNGTLHCAHSKAGLRDLESRQRQQQARGAPTQLLDAEETQKRTGTNAFHGALFDPRAGTIQPLDYCRGLAQVAIRAGAQLFEKSPATTIEAIKDGWRVATPGGSVTAKSLLLATNAYAPDLADLPKRQFVPMNYFQLATKPIAQDRIKSILPNGEGCWDTALIMSSFRRDEAGRIIIGSIGDLTHAASFTHKDWAQRKLAALFPDLKDETLEYAWCGRISMTDDHLPKIVRLGANGYAVFGYSGRGIGPGTVFGKAIAAAIAENDEALMPIVPVVHHSERLPKGQAAFYEFGAGLTHLVDAR